MFVSRWGEKDSCSNRINRNNSMLLKKKTQNTPESGLIFAKVLIQLNRDELKPADTFYKTFQQF